jgi:2-haloacid dehalogenase
MVGDIDGVQLTDDDVEEIRQAMLTMPAHPDVEPGLTRLRDAGFRMVTLTNSPSDEGPQGLGVHGTASYFILIYRSISRSVSTVALRWPSIH